MQIHIYIYLVLGDTQLLPGQSMRHHRSKARGQSNTMSRNNRRGNTKKFNMQELNPINGMQQSPPIGPGALHLQQYERAYLEILPSSRILPALVCRVPRAVLTNIRAGPRV